jgi:hypothetical protein
VLKYLKFVEKPGLIDFVCTVKARAFERACAVSHRGVLSPFLRETKDPKGPPKCSLCTSTVPNQLLSPMLFAVAEFQQ